MKLLFKRISILIIFLTACGGGVGSGVGGDANSPDSPPAVSGGNVSSTSTSQASSTATAGGTSSGQAQASNSAAKPNAYFQSSGYNLPSFTTLVSGLCVSPNVGGLSSTIALADLNADGKKDIVISYWCSHRPAGENYSGPTPNTIIVYLSQPDGTYTIGNKKLFGSDIVDIGGGGMSMAVADFNNDGKPDIGVGVSREDGRAHTTNEAYNAPQAILLSQADGSYIVKSLPITAASGTAQAVANNVGGYDFVYPVSPASPVAAYRWQNNSFNQITSYPRASVAMNFLPPTNPNSGSQELITNPNGSNGPSALELISYANGAWNSKSTYSYPQSMANAIGWKGIVEPTTYASIGGVNMTYATFESSCALKLTPNDPTHTRFARVVGFPTPSNWDGVSTLDQRTVNNVSFLVPFSMKDGNLTPINSGIFDSPMVDQSFTNYSCVDINDDGYSDVVIYIQGSTMSKTTGTPIFYLNNKNGKLIKTTIDNIPTPPQGEKGWVDSSSVYEDINGDGINDLIYFTTLTPSNPLNYSLQIFYGTKKIGN